MSTPIPAYRTAGSPLYSSADSSVQLISLEAVQPSRRLLVLKSSTHTRNLQELSVMRRLTEWQNSQKGQALFPRLKYYQQNASRVDMVMEYCTGGDLAKEILGRRGNRPKAVEARRILIQLTDALQKLHSFGIAHCDIKPHNVFLDDRGTALLGDFGHAVDSTSATEKKNDVFMLGCTFLEYLAGEVGLKLNRLTESECTAKLESALRSFPGSFLPLLQAMLAFSPSRRISAQEAFELISSENEEEAERCDCGVSEERQERDTVVLPAYKLIELDSGFLRTARPISSGRSFERRESPAPDQFTIDSTSLVTILECQNVDKELLRKKIENLLQWKNKHGGVISCEVEAEMFACTHKGHNLFAAKKASELECGCVYCKNCLNEHVLASFDGQPLSSMVTCSCGRTSFDSMSDALRSAINPRVIERFDSEIVKAFIHCPKCSSPTNEVNGIFCKSLKCLRCSYKFCSFCLKRAHHIGCDKWKEQLKTLNKK